MIINGNGDDQTDQYGYIDFGNGVDNMMKIMIMIEMLRMTMVMID